MATLGRLSKVWTRLQCRKISKPDIRNRISGIAGDLVFLLVFLHGLLQTRTEMDRGNILGGIICLGFTTPLLAVLARGLAIVAGNRLFRT